jgi:hypothetical protein
MPCKSYFNMFFGTAIVLLLEALVLGESQYFFDVRVDPAEEIARLAVVVRLVREERVFPDHRQQVPDEERVAPRPAGFSRQHRLSVCFIQGEFAAEVADVRAVRLFKVEIAQGERFAKDAALGLQRVAVEPPPVQGPQLSPRELHLKPLHCRLHLLA